MWFTPIDTEKKKKLRFNFLLIEYNLVEGFFLIAINEANQGTLT